MSLRSPALAGGFLTTSATLEAHVIYILYSYFFVVFYSHTILFQAVNPK